MILNHLYYALLGEREKLPFIILFSMNQEQETKLLDILRQFKKAIGLSIIDFKGISPSIFMHKILLEGGAKPTKDIECRLNSIKNEVMKK